MRYLRHPTLASPLVASQQTNICASHPWAAGETDERKEYLLRADWGSDCLTRAQQLQDKIADLWVVCGRVHKIKAQHEVETC